MKIFCLFPVIFFLSCAEPVKNPVAENESPKTEEVIDTNNCKLRIDIPIQLGNPQHTLENFERLKPVRALDFKNKTGLYFFDFEKLEAEQEIPVFAADSNGKLLRVNSIYFSDLQHVAAHRNYEEQTVGKCTPLLFSKISARDIILLLMKAEIIETYDHLNAEVCLKDEAETGEKYIAYFTGVYHYCTNDCNDVFYKFAVELNKKSGEIVVKPWKK